VRGAVKEHDALVLEDLVDHPEVSATGRVEALELSTQRPPGAVRIHRDRVEDRGEDGVAHLVR
jgi:hypothetical protein